MLKKARHVIHAELQSRDREGAVLRPPFQHPVSARFSRGNDVAHALVRATSPLLATLGFDSVFMPGVVSRRV